MKVRLLMLALGLLLCTSFAFAGPQISIADPGCQPGDTQLFTNTFTFTYDSNHPVMTFCNSTEDTWESLNFTITLPSAIDLAGIYCGGPDQPYTDGNSPAFDFCMVLDPSRPLVEGGEPHGYAINSTLIHEFDVNWEGGPDTPTSFFSGDSCFYGCPTTFNDPDNLKNIVELSFQLQPTFEFAALVNALDDVDCTSTDPRQGLRPGCQFTISLACPPDLAGCNADDWNGAVFNGLASPFANTQDFPAPVPEPASIALLSGGALTMLRRVKRNRAANREKNHC